MNIEQNKKKEFTKHLLFVLTILSICVYIFLQVPVIKELNLLRYFSYSFLPLEHRYEKEIFSISPMFYQLTGILNINLVLTRFVYNFISFLKNLVVVIPFGIYIAYVVVAFKTKRSKITSIILSSIILIFIIVLSAINSTAIIDKVNNFIFKLAFNKFYKMLYTVSFNSVCTFLIVPAINKIIIYIILTCLIFINISNLVDQFTLKKYQRILLNLFIFTMFFAFEFCLIGYIISDSSLNYFSMINNYSNESLKFIYNVTIFMFVIVKTLLKGIATIVISSLLLTCLIYSIVIIIKKNKAVKILGGVLIVLTLTIVVGFIISQICSYIITLMLYGIIYLFMGI